MAFVLPFPDEVQSYWASPVGNLDLEEAHQSPQIRTLLEVWGTLKERMPYGLEDVPIVFANGCRPVNFHRPREVVPPSGSVLASCRRRWQAEIRIIDPAMVVAMGHWAFAALWPDKQKKSNYTAAIGEVLPFEIPTPRGPAQYLAYVATSPWEVDRYANDRQRNAAWTGIPPYSGVREPVEALRWHLFRAAWITKVMELSDAAGDLSIPAPGEGGLDWSFMVRQLNVFYDCRDDVSGVVSAVMEHVEYVNQTEESDQNVRLAQIGDIPVQRPKTYNLVKTETP
jgi:hypothetical protein